MTDCLVDTNIFIYSLNADSIYHDRCKQILSSNLNLFTTTKNLSEYFAVCTKLDFPESEVNNFYQSIKENIEFLFPTTESIKIFEDLFNQIKPKGNRIYDVEVASIMLSNNISDLATINKTDFKDISGINLIEF